MPPGSTQEALLHLRRWKVVCRSEAGICPGSFYPSWKRLAMLPQMDCLVCPTHTENAASLLSVRQKEDARTHFVWWGFWRPEIPDTCPPPQTVLTSYSASALPAADDPGRRSRCLDLSLQQCMSGLAQGGSEHPYLQGLEAVDCFAHVCCPKHTAESASVQSALDLKMPAFPH